MGRKIENRQAVVESMRVERLEGRSPHNIAKRYGVSRQFVEKNTIDTRGHFFYDTQEESVAMRRILRAEVEFFSKRHGIGMRAIAERAGLGKAPLVCSSQFGQPLGIRKDTVRKLRAAMALIEKEMKK